MGTGYKNRGSGAAGLGFKNRGAKLVEGAAYTNRGATDGVNEAFKNRGQAWGSDAYYNRGPNDFASLGTVNPLNTSEFYAPLTHSLILTRGTGDPTYTQTTNTWEFDNEGKLILVPSGAARFGGARMVRNLLGYTEDFSNAYWTKLNTIVTANASVAPDGSVTADFLKEDSANGAHAVYKGTLGQTTEHTFSVYAKAAGRTKILLVIDNIIAEGVIFDLSAVTTTPNNVNYTKYSIDDVGNGWYRCSITAPTVNNSVSAAVFLYTTTSSYAGDNTSGVYLWGAQLEPGAYPNEYVSSGVLSAPFHGGGADGVKWYNTSGYPLTVVLGDSTYAAYGGHQEVSRYVVQSGSPVFGIHSLAAAGETTTQQYNRWVSLASHIKSAASIVVIRTGLNDLGPSTTAATVLANMQSKIDLILASAPHVDIWVATLNPAKERFVDLYGAIDGATVYQMWLDVNAGITNTLTSVTGRITTHTAALNDGSGNLAVAYDTGDHIHPNEAGRIVMAAGFSTDLQFPTKSPISDATLLGYHAEWARTNSLLYSRDLTNAAWAATNITPAKTATGIDNAANSASTLTASAADATILQTLSLAAAARSFSAYVKRRTGSGSVYITRDGGTNWTDITSSLGASWTRVKIENTSVLNPSVGFKIATSGDEIDVDVCQDEAGAGISSPIITTTAAVTRNADDETFQTASNWSDTAGWALATVQGESWANATGTAIGNGTNGLKLSASNSGIVAYDGTNTVNGPAGSPSGAEKLAMTWGSGALQAASGGVAGSAGSYDGAWGLATVGIGTSQGNVYIKDVYIGQSALTAAQLAQVTA